MPSFDELKNDDEREEYYDNVDKAIRNGPLNAMNIEWDLQQPPTGSDTDNFIARMDAHQHDLGRDFSDGWTVRHFNREFPQADSGLEVYPEAAVRDLREGRCYYNGSLYDVHYNADGCPWIESNGQWFKVREDTSYLDGMIDSSPYRDRFEKYESGEQAVEDWLDTEW